MSIDKAYLGGGCFWCLDAVYRRVRGVLEVESGYAGGDTENPDYEQVSSGQTGHAEVVAVTYNPKLISYRTLLKIFWHIHDPTTPNRQGFDVGTQYRSIILYANDQQKQQAEVSLKEANKLLWNGKIVTEINPLGEFYPAEDYHQDYFAKNPTAGYCQVVINPKLNKFLAKFEDIVDN